MKNSDNSHKGNVRATNVQMGNITRKPPQSADASRPTHAKANKSEVVRRRQRDSQRDKHMWDQLSKANRLKFHVAHCLKKTIKAFDHTQLPQTGVHAHQHMAEHLSASPIGRNRSVVRADSIGEVRLTLRRPEAATTKAEEKMADNRPSEQSTSSKVHGSSQLQLCSKTGKKASAKTDRAPTNIAGSSIREVTLRRPGDEAATTRAEEKMTKNRPSEESTRTEAHDSSQLQLCSEIGTPASAKTDCAPSPQRKKELFEDKTATKTDDDMRLPSPWTAKQKFVLTDQSILKEFKIGEGVACQTQLADNLQLCAICDFLLVRHCSECLERKRFAMKRIQTVTEKHAELLLGPLTLPAVFEVFRVNLFYDEMVASEEQSWQDLNALDEFMADVTTYYRKEWSRLLVVYKLAFQLLSCTAVNEPKDAKTEAAVSELLLRGSTAKATDGNAGKLSFVQGIISVILDQNIDSRERAFAVIILERASNILNLSLAVARLSPDQQKQQTQALWRTLHVALLDIIAQPNACPCGGPVGIKEILQRIQGLIASHTSDGASILDDMLNDSTDIDLELDELLMDDTPEDPRCIDASMMKITMRVVTGLHTLPENSISWYHGELVVLAVKLALLNTEIATSIINSLLKKWPWASHKKQILFLHTLERVLDSVWYQDDLITAVLPRLLRVLSRVVTAEHSLVMRQLFPLFVNEQISTTIWFSHLDDVLPALYPRLQITAKTHWDSDSVRIAQLILNMLEKLDPDVFEHFKKSIK